MDYDIKDYMKDLSQLCLSCKLAKRCKDKNKVCMTKKIVFNIAKTKLKRREKVGVTK